MIHLWWILPFVAGFGAGALGCLYCFARSNTRLMKHYNKHTFYSQHENVGRVVGMLSTPLPPVLEPTEKQCSLDGCKELTGSSWDDRCYDHSLYNDSGRP